MTRVMNALGRYIIIASIIGVTVLAPSVSVHAEIQRNLRYGDSGTDVKELQQLLNKDPDTAIASSGPGSVGAETTYFGQLTLAAVKRFQQKYAAEILTPLNIYSPTGFVGERTRNKLATVMSSPTAILPATSTPTDIAQTNKPMITSVSPSIVSKTAQEITLIGKNFSLLNNTITVTSEQTKAITGIASTDGTTLKFTYHPAFADQLLQKVAAAKYAGGNKALAQIVAQNIVEKSPADGSVRIPFSVYVRNDNGSSDPAIIFVDLAAILNNISE